MIRPMMLYLVLTALGVGICALFGVGLEWGALAAFVVTTVLFLIVAVQDRRKQLAWLAGFLLALVIFAAATKAWQ